MDISITKRAGEACNDLENKLVTVINKHLAEKQRTFCELENNALSTEVLHVIYQLYQENPSPNEPFNEDDLKRKQWLDENGYYGVLFCMGETSYLEKVVDRLINGTTAEKISMLEQIKQHTTPSDRAILQHEKLTQAIAGCIYNAEAREAAISLASTLKLPQLETLLKGQLPADNPSLEGAILHGLGSVGGDHMDTLELVEQYIKVKLRHIHDHQVIKSLACFVGSHDPLVREKALDLCYYIYVYEVIDIALYGQQMDRDDNPLKALLFLLMEKGVRKETTVVLEDAYSKIDPSYRYLLLSYLVKATQYKYMDDLFALLEQNHPEAIHLMIDLYNVTKDELVVEFLLKSSQYEDVVPRTFLVQLNKLLLADLKGCIKKYCQDERLKNYLLKNFNAEQIPFSQYNTLLHKKKIIKEKLTDLEVKKLEFDYYEDHLHFNKLHHFLRNTQVFIEKKKEEEHHQDKQDLIKEMCAITHDFFNDVTFCTFSVENYKQFDHYIFLSTRSRVFLFKLTEPQKEGDPSELDQLISMMNCILIKLDKEERFANIEISYDYKTVLFGNISMLSNFVDSYFAS